MTTPTAEQLAAVLNILTNARDAALIDKVAIEIGLKPTGGGLSFLGHLQMAAQAVGADFLPVHLPEHAERAPHPGIDVVSSR